MGVSLHQLPYFMNELTLTELDMGTSIPSVLSASNPTINERGKSPTEAQGPQCWLQDGAASPAPGAGRAWQGTSSSDLCDADLTSPCASPWQGSGWTWRSPTAAPCR